MIFNRVELAGLLVGVAGVGACTTVRRVQPAEYLANNSPAVVWVTYANQTVVPVFDPVIRRDTLRGKLNGARVKIPLSEIQSAQVKVPDHAKTALLAASVGVAAVSVLYIGFISQAGSHAAGTNCGLDAFGDQINVC